MSAFDECWAFTLGAEGGYWDDPAGGPTMYGITQRVASAWGYHGDMRHLPLDDAKAIARKEYFDKYQCGQLPAQFALLVFDTAYHGGKPVAWLQECIGTTPDGIIGAKTVAAARAANIPRTIALFCARRLRYLQSLKNWKENAGGWTLRICALIEKGVA